MEDQIVCDASCGAIFCQKNGLSFFAGAVCVALRCSLIAGGGSGGPGKAGGAGGAGAPAPCSGTGMPVQGGGGGGGAGTPEDEVLLGKEEGGGGGGGAEGAAVEETTAGLESTCSDEASGAIGTLGAGRVMRTLAANAAILSL